MGVPGSWKTPASALNLKLAGRAKGAEEVAEGEIAKQAREKARGWGRLLVVKRLNFKELSDELLLEAMLRLEGGPGND